MENEELENKIQADIEKYNSLRESGANMSEAFTEATKSEEQIVNEKLENIKENIYESIDDMRNNFSFEVEQFKADEGYGFGGGVNDSAIDNELDKFIEKYNSDIRDLENQVDSINKLENLEDKQMFLDIYKEEGIEKAVEQFKNEENEEKVVVETNNWTDDLYNEEFNVQDKLSSDYDLNEAANELQNNFNNAVEAVENAGYDKSEEGQAIDVVKEVATAGYDIEDSKLSEMVNEKFGTELSELDINSIKEVVGKEMNGEIEAIDNSKDLSMNDIKEINGESSSQEISVQGDHATVKEDTMAGEQTERVVDRETGLNEMDKAVGVDSDKVETKEESALRDGLSAEDQKILDSFDKSEKEITLNDAMESFNSKPQNAELSQENEGQKNAESAKQK